MGYSYIVIRRGPRPANPGTEVGRLGLVGRTALEKTIAAQTPIKELFLHNEQHELAQPEEQMEVQKLEDNQAVEDPLTPAGLNAALRLEAYNWPRLIFPPLKKAGHVILDGCTPEGKSFFRRIKNSTDPGDRQNYAHDGSQIARKAAIL